MSKTGIDIETGIVSIMLIRAKLLLLTIAISISLSGCSAIWPYKSDFDCSIPEGQKCKSLYEINKMVDEGKFEPDAVDFSQEVEGKKNSKKYSCEKQCKINKGSNNAC